MILYYPGNQPEWISDVKKLLPGKEILLISDKQKGMTMNELAGMKQEQIAMEGQSGEPFMFWVDEDPKEVPLFQKALDAQNKAIDRMAMKTANNMDWTFEHLYDEVSAEAHWFETRDKLAALIQQADRERLEKEPKYAQAVMSCYSLLQSDQEIPQRLLDLAVEMLMAANQNI